jgi:hypothetical protein
MSQLREDLENRIIEKHQQWKRDSAALYEMGGLELSDFMQDYYLIIVAEMCKVMYAFDIPCDPVFNSIRKTVAILNQADEIEDRK